jgi:hypothetical protein
MTTTSTTSTTIQRATLHAPSVAVKANEALPKVLAVVGAGAAAATWFAGGSVRAQDVQRFMPAETPAPTMTLVDARLAARTPPNVQSAEELSGTAGMTTAEKFEHYTTMIARGGGKFDPNRGNIVGVRTTTNSKENGGRGAYDDVFAVGWRDKSGAPRVSEFVGNTEPNASYAGRLGVDVNRDGTRDQGRMRVGHYRFTAAVFKGKSALAMIGDARIDRDTNHDGNFGNDRGASSMGAASMLFHRGGITNTGSAGCQTMQPADFQRFMWTLQQAGGTGNVGYTLVNR